MLPGFFHGIGKLVFDARILLFMPWSPLRRVPSDGRYAWNIPDTATSTSGQGAEKYP
jgi:hypothetical protein